MLNRKRLERKGKIVPRISQKNRFPLLRVFFTDLTVPEFSLMNCRKILHHFELL